MASRIRARGGLFMASVFDCESLAQWAGDLDAIKIASGDLDFDPLLRVAARSGKPIVLSTGMSTLEEIGRAAKVIETALSRGTALADRLAILHCVSLYPTPLDKTNLAAMATLRSKFGVTVGYSDHTLGIASALVALGLGARIVEKHFTLDKNYSAFRDHALSAEPAEFAALAQAFKAHAAMLGDGGREGDLPDATTRTAARRGIVTARDIAQGEILSAADLDYVRPAKGFPPSAAAQVIGRSARTALKAHHVISAEDLA
jgi:N-acetylneuraminate synthase/N,N'-diacetyllegionaminate synthase